MQGTGIKPGPGHPQGSRGATEPSAATCNVNDWMQDLDEGVCNEEVRRIDDVSLTDRSELAPVLNALVEVVDDIGDRKYCGFLEAPPEACHLQVVGVFMKEATEVLHMQQ